MSIDLQKAGKVIRETRDFMKAARAAREEVQDAKRDDSPGGEKVTPEERDEIIEAFAHAGVELAQLLGASAAVALEIGVLIKEKLNK